MGANVFVMPGAGCRLGFYDILQKQILHSRYKEPVFIEAPALTTIIRTTEASSLTTIPTSIQIILLKKNQIGLLSTKYLTRCILEKIIHLSDHNLYYSKYCKETRTSHVKGHASLKILDNAVHAKEFY
jgi:hypothetical protein